MCMSKLKPDRIVILQKNLFFLRWTIGFTRNLNNTIHWCTISKRDCRWFGRIYKICNLKTYLVHIFISFQIQ